MSKVVFLDIDGVLNRRSLHMPQEKSPTGYIGVQQEYINYLKEIIDNTGAYIVLTSDWKDCFKEDNCNPETADEDGKYLVKRLSDSNLHIVARTDDKSKGDDYRSGRGNGIRRYLESHSDITHYVILDDVPFSSFTNELLPHFVHCEKPLNKNYVDSAIYVLTHTENELENTCLDSDIIF